ncbi:post-GPI attachment to proteins factor 4-like [Syngnathus acus]|uniref:post-GPI attachment to proteins factor 4-like n=1 Tax=Syngnathus acus TaxID=161584 RepID=UPI001885F2C6|nr:post-GPI attachment to proteins factor 4-like [Syngnathus acus]
MPPPRCVRRCGGAATQVLVVFALTFCVALPAVCHRLLHSYYFVRSAYLDDMNSDALRQSLQRGQDALLFWQKAPSTATTEPPRHPELLVTVVTTRRPEALPYHYLLQVTRQLSSLQGDCGERPCAQVVLCDVESGPDANEDAVLLERHFRVIRPPAGRQPNNTFEREKRDYVFCLRRAFQLALPRNMLVLEDDALPHPDFFHVAKDLLRRRFASRSLYIKLFHPERLQHYWNPEPYRILEWFGLGLLGATLLLQLLTIWNPCRWSLRMSARHLALLAVYVMAGAELLGRHYLLELRRLSPQLYAVSPATNCCTPAMLYPGNTSLRVADYLDRAFCFRGNAKDTVLYQTLRNTPGERAHSVEPNLVTHIGAFSSIRPKSGRPKLL